MGSAASDHLFAEKGHARPAGENHQPAQALLGSIEAKLQAKSERPSNGLPAQPEMFPLDPEAHAPGPGEEPSEPGSLLTIDLKRPRIPNLALAISEPTEAPTEAPASKEPEPEPPPCQAEVPVTPAANGTPSVTPDPVVYSATSAREPDGLSPFSQALIAGLAVACLAGGLWYAMQTSGERTPALSQGSTPELGVQQTAALPAEPASTPEPAVAPLPEPQPSVAPPETVPSFDLVRIEPDGQAVLAGRAEPNAELIILDNGKPLGTVRADSVGEWAFVPDRALPDGDHDFSLVVNTPQGTITVPGQVPDKPEAKPEVAPLPDKPAAKPPVEPDLAPPPPSAALQPPVPERKPNALAGSGTFAIQLASVSSQSDAEAAWQRLRETYPALLDDVAPTIEPAEIENQGLRYRVRAGDFAKAEQAETLCRALRSQDQDCIVVQR
ncbi:MAG: SPOR domain-containing protein [Pseudomonadota bacterium]